MKYAVYDHLRLVPVSKHGSYALAKAKATKLHDKQSHESAMMNRYEVIPADAEAERLEAKLAAHELSND